MRLPHVDGAVTTLVEATVDRPRQTDAGVIVRLRDVTEREERVRALEQARRRFQQAFHSAPTGMALVRLDDSTILDANRSLADMLARPVEELVGRSIRDITHPEDLRAAAAYRARLELGIADTYLLDQRYLRSDGEFVWARTASRSPRTRACRWRSPTSRTSPSSGARPSGCSGRRRTTT